MKKLQNITILLLSITLIYLYFYNRSRIQELQQKALSLEKSISLMQEEYETKIAFLKAGVIEDEEQDMKKETQGTKPSFALKTVKSRKNTVAEMKKKLRLRDEQMQSIETVLNKYQKKKQEIFETVKKGNEFQFGSFAYLNKLKAASDEAYHQIKGILDASQYQAMIKNNYDLSLGIRIPEKLFSGRDRKTNSPSQTSKSEGSVK
jgi:hypothetical protein